MKHQNKKTNDHISLFLYSSTPKKKEPGPSQELTQKSRNTKSKQTIVIDEWRTRIALQSTILFPLAQQIASPRVP